MKMSPTRSILASVAVTVVLLILAARMSAQTPSAAPAEPDFQALVTKTNLYVKALNAVSGVQRSYDRYASWVDLKKGVTGKEPYISYGLYDISKSIVDDIRDAAEKGPKMSPPLPDLDAVVVRLSEAVVALAPLVNKASAYYEHEDFKDDGAKLGRELHQQMMPLFEHTFAAETELRRGLDNIKADLDRKQLAEIERVNGKKYEWHLRNYMIAAKGVVSLLPEDPDAPLIKADAYKARYDELESAYNAFQAFTSEHPDEVKKVTMASFVESAVKDFFTASKFLRRTLEAPKPGRREYIERLGNLAKAYNELIQRSNSFR